MRLMESQNMPKAKPEFFRGAAVVRLEVVNRANVRGYRVSWSQPIPQAVLLPTEAAARSFGERVAAGEAPIKVLGEVLARRFWSNHGSKAGRRSWEGLTPEERTARAQANARARWAKVKGTPSALAAEGGTDGE